MLEHVADDCAAFRELARVLRPLGRLLFTVPLADAEETVTRAVEESGVVKHLLELQFHGDRIRGTGKVLVFRDCGRDITNRLRRTRGYFGQISIDLAMSGPSWLRKNS